ncbi:HAMP domain-containing protein [Shigella flexneri]
MVSNSDPDLPNEPFDPQHCHIASGDLVKRIEVEGSNEIGQLAESLRHMQGELMKYRG